MGLEEQRIVLYALAKIKSTDKRTLAKFLYELECKIGYPISYWWSESNGNVWSRELLSDLRSLRDEELIKLEGDNISIVDEVAERIEAKYPEDAKSRVDSKFEEFLNNFMA